MEELTPKFVNLINPKLCSNCRFGNPIVISDGNKKETFMECLRLDCDNWDYSSIINVQDITSL